jgi:hypothetical protein
MENKNTIYYRQKKKERRVTGDNFLYFLSHNMISIFLFFTITLAWGLYGEKNSSIVFFISKDFWTLFGMVFFISILSGISARIIVYVIINKIYTSNEKHVKKFSEINTGVNKLGLNFFLSTFFTCLVFCLGLVTVLQEALFKELTIFTLIFTYVGIKIVIFFIIKMFKI